MVNWNATAWWASAISVERYIKKNVLECFKTTQLNNREDLSTIKMLLLQYVFLFGQWQKDPYTQLNKSSYERVTVWNVKVFTNSNKEIYYFIDKLSKTIFICVDLISTKSKHK